MTPHTTVAAVDKPALAQAFRDLAATRNLPYAAEVCRGAAFLDREEPGWASVINPNQLSLISPCKCILGQLHGNYFHSPFTIRLHTNQEMEEWAAPLGLDIVGGGGYEYDLLTATWRALVEGRYAHPEGAA
jgi:hypothetical protein